MSIVSELALISQTAQTNTAGSLSRTPPSESRTRDPLSRVRDWPDTDPPVPLPARLIPLATFLRDRGYPPDTITGIVASAARNGSVQCAERRLRAADLDGAEATLEGNAWAWGAGTDSEWWELNPGC